MRSRHGNAGAESSLQFEDAGPESRLTVTVLLTLALGIGANTAIFTVDFATLLARCRIRSRTSW